MPRGQAGRRGRVVAAAGGAAQAAPAPAPQEHPAVARLREAVPLIELLAARLLGLPTAASPPPAQQSLALSELFQGVHKAVDGPARALRLLTDPALTPALLRLTAASMRWSPDEWWRAPARTGDPWRVRGHRCLGDALDGTTLLAWLCASSVCSTTCQLEAMVHMLRVCRALLRMQLLHSSAQQLAEAAAVVRSVAPLPEHADPFGPWEALGSVLDLLCLPAHAMHLLASRGERDGQLEAECVALCSELADALRSSRVLEHWAQGLVVLAAARPHGGSEDCERFNTEIGLLYCAINNVAGRDTGASVSPAARAALDHLAAALRPPGLRHLLLAGGVLALAREDGGPVYGLDTELYGRLHPGGGWERRPLAGGVTHLRCFANMLLGCPVHLDHLPARVWPHLLLRLAAAAVAREAALAEAGRSDPDVAPVATAALLELAPLLTRPSATQQLREEAWALLLRATDAALQDPAGRSESKEAEDALLKLLQRYVETMQPPAPPDVGVAPALSAGLLPHLERLLRRTMRAAAPSPSSIATASEFLRNLPALAVLTRGSPREAAALLATLRKMLLEGTGAKAFARCMVTGRIPYGVGIFANAFLRTLHQLATSAGAPAVGAGAGAGAAAEAPGGAAAAAAASALPPAAWAVVTLAVCELLPAAAGLILWFEPVMIPTLAVAARGCATSRQGVWEHALLHPGLLEGCCLLMAACEQQQRGSGQQGAEAASGEGGGGWRQFLLQRVRVVELVGAALRFYAQALRVHGAIRPAAVGDHLRALVEAAARAAWLFPEEVGAAAAVRAGAGRGGRGAACSRTARAGAGRGAGGAPSWPVAELLPHLRVHGGQEVVALAEWLASCVAAWEAGGQAPARVRPPLRATQPLPLEPPAEALAVLRTCSYPECANLEGDSEAGTRLQTCAGCGTARYCCRACQVAHRKAGHKEACGGG